MKSILCSTLLLWTAHFADAASLRLTIYNSRFGVVRETLSLDLHQGENEVRYTDVTERVDPGSVILRDPAGKMELRILEQSFRAEPLNQERMLTLFEGETIPFQFRDGANIREVKGKIIRGTYPQSEGSGKNGSPIIELDGR